MSLNLLLVCGEQLNEHFDILIVARRRELYPAILNRYQDILRAVLVVEPCSTEELDQRLRDESFNIPIAKQAESKIKTKKITKQLLHVKSKRNNEDELEESKHNGDDVEAADNVDAGDDDGDDADSSRSAASSAACSKKPSRIQPMRRAVAQAGWIHLKHLTDQV